MCSGTYPFFRQSRRASVPQSRPATLDLKIGGCGDAFIQKCLARSVPQRWTEDTATVTRWVEPGDAEPKEDPSMIDSPSFTKELASAIWLFDMIWKRKTKKKYPINWIWFFFFFLSFLYVILIFLLPTSLKEPNFSKCFSKQLNLTKKTTMEKV